MFTKGSIENYFSVFKNEQLLLIILGAAALFIAILFYVLLKTQWYKGFALPLAVFALIFCGAGFSNYKKTDSLRVRADYNYDMHPEQLKTKELPRIREMQKNLRVLIDIDITIIIASLLLFFYFKSKEENEYYIGSASSLFLMASLSIIIYFWIINTDKPYAAGIENYTSKIIVNKTAG